MENIHTNDAKDSIKHEYDAAIDAIRERINKCLLIQSANAFAWMSTHQLRKNIGISDNDKQRFLETLTNMETDGQIIKYKEDDGRDYYWRLFTI